MYSASKKTFQSPTVTQGHNPRIRDMTSTTSRDARGLSARGRHSLSSSSLASINSADQNNSNHRSGRQNGNHQQHFSTPHHFRFSSAASQESNSSRRHQKSQKDDIDSPSPFLQVFSGEKQLDLNTPCSSNSISQISSGAAARHSDEDMGRIYHSSQASHQNCYKNDGSDSCGQHGDVSSQDQVQLFRSSGSSKSRDSKASSTLSNDRRIHLSNMELTFEGDQSDENTGTLGAGNSIIRIEMQPKIMQQTQEEEQKLKTKPNARKKTTKMKKPRLEKAGVSSKSSSKKSKTVKEHNDILFGRGSSAMLALEQTHLFGEGIMMRISDKTNGQQEIIMDLDSEQGVEVCKIYLCSVETLIKSCGLPLTSRSYRECFTNSYKILYQQMHEQLGSEAAYLPEILDSAQEAFDHLWVNAEKYVFSDNVLESGKILFSQFSELRIFISKFFQTYFLNGKHFRVMINSKQIGNFGSDCAKLKEMLVGFDEAWTKYEHKYVCELMVIENDARRFIINSIEIERDLMTQNSQACREQYDESRRVLLENIGQVNAVANLDEGKGRDQFNIEVLQLSEKLIEQSSLDQEQEKVEQYSSAVTKLANNVVRTFESYRALLRQYQTNIELVDPQLKNNAALVKTIVEFEDAWSIAQNQLVESKNLDQLNQFSQLLQKTQDDLPQFKELVECRDSTIFMSIPGLLIVEALLEQINFPAASTSIANNKWRDLCKRFKEDITEKEDWLEAVNSFKTLINASGGTSSGFLIELCLQVLELEQPSTSASNAVVVSATSEMLSVQTNHVKNLGMELQRGQPMDWNEFINACIFD